MSYLVLAFLLVVLVPLLAASWRVSLLGLALQGLLLGWMALRMHPDVSLSTAFILVDLAVIRGIVAPHALYRVLATTNAPRRNDVIPPNLFSWAMIGGLVFVSFRFATEVLEADLGSSLHLATVTAALVLGMFVLSSQNSMFNQMVGLLRIENALALFELMSPHHFPLPIQVGMSVVYLFTALMLGRFLRGEFQHGAESWPARERPTL
jgi:hydrogenase-4 component E